MSQSVHCTGQSQELLSQKLPNTNFPNWKAERKNKVGGKNKRDRHRKYSVCTKTTRKGREKRKEETVTRNFPNFLSDTRSDPGGSENVRINEGRRALDITILKL